MPDVTMYSVSGALPCGTPAVLSMRSAGTSELGAGSRHYAQRGTEEDGGEEEEGG